jgi:translin
MKKLTENLDIYADRVRQNLTVKDEAREKVLPLCRELIRYASITIRAVHRREFAQAGELLNSGREVRDALEKAVAEWEELRYTGFFRDAHKEFTEASATLALVKGEPLPGPDELKVDYTAYLNGLGDTVGELRRYMLDSMRHGDLSRGEELLSAMDDIYTVLVTMDFPDAITGGLRHTTDNVRGILEKTRGDLTLAVTQKELETRICNVQKNES